MGFLIEDKYYIPDECQVHRGPWGFGPGELVKSLEVPSLKLVEAFQIIGGV